MVGVLTFSMIALAGALWIGGGLSPSGPATDLLASAEGIVAMTEQETTTSLDGTWSVTWIAGADLPEAAQVVMHFGGGMLAGSGGCRGYQGEATVEGDRLNLGEMTFDNEECAPELMRADTDFMRALEVCDRFVIGADGTLTLYAQTLERVKARRADAG